MLRRSSWLLPLVLLGALAGCQPAYDERNAFLRYTEDFGANASSTDDEDSQAGGTEAETVFRLPLQITLANNHPDADLTVNFAAWVNVSSIRSADQQDELLRSGYVQLPREVRLGALTLAPGTFVFNGPGVAGATRLRIAAGDVVTPATLVTPDVILLFLTPPNSCSDIGFTYTQDGLPLGDEAVPDDTYGLIFGGATGTGGLKTLAEYDVYQCQPFRPGLYLRIGGGTPERNEFFEGENIRYDFFDVPPNNDGEFAVLTIAR